MKRLQTKYPDAKALLSEGLAEEGMDPNPENLTVELYTRGVSEYSKKSAEWMKQMYKENLGVNLNINMTEWNVMYDLVESGDYDLACMGWNADVCLEPSEFLDLFDPVEGYYGPQQRWTGTEADKYHELVETYQAMGYDDLQAKADAYLAAEEWLMEYGSAITTYATKSRTLVGKYVHGYAPHPMVMNDYSNVWLSER